MATHTAHLLWSCIYSSATNMAAITAATIKYAIDFATAACEQRAINEEQRQLEVLRFEEMNSSSTSECNDSDDLSVGSDESFSKHLNSGASRVFRTVSLRPKQQEAVRRIVCN
mmetsp:Transcript_9142/g.13773  ORF Transcript_9142/g.13773 Transcript_9142/m.13773 type:complete len:113 (-) Transcript_9142:170-508(-)